MKNQKPLKVITIDLTGKCNQKCIHCGRQNTSSSIDVSQLKKLIKQGKELGLSDMILSGGEPFIHPEINNILKELTRSGIYISILTNGSTLDEKIVSILNDYPNISFVRVSIESTDPSLLDKIRNNRGVFKKIDNGINLLSSNKIPFGISMTISSLNLQHMEKVFNYTVKNKSLFIRFSPYLEVNSNSQLKAVEPHVVAIKSLNILSKNLEYVSSSSLPIIPSCDKYGELFANHCPAGNFTAYVTSDFYLNFCPFYRVYPISLNKYNLEKAWDNLCKTRKYLYSNLKKSGSCLISKDNDEAGYSLRKIFEKVCLAAIKSGQKRKALSTIIARQTEQVKIGYTPCWRSSPLFLTPLKH